MAKLTNKKITIHGRKVPLLELDDKLPLKKIAKQSSRGSHILIPKKYEGHFADVKILVPKPFVCKDCIEVFTKKEHFSPEEKLCIFCYKEKKKYEEYVKLPKEKQICSVCKKHLSPADYKSFWCNGYHIECAEKMQPEYEIEEGWN